MKYYLLFIVVLFGSCKSFYKALDSKRIIKAEVRNPSLLRDKCLKSFPPITSYKDSIKYVAGKPDTTFSMVEVDCDTVTNDNYIDRIVKIPVPRIIKSVDTQFHVSTIIEQDTREIDKLSEENQNLREEVAKESTYRKLYWWFALVGWAFIAISVFVKLFNPFGRLRKLF